MATYDYSGLANGDNLPSSHIIDVGTWEIGSERLKPTTQGSKLHIVTDAGSGVGSVDLHVFSNSTTLNCGVWRGDDVDNCFLFINKPSDNSLRLLKIVGGVSTDLFPSETIAGVATTDTRSLSLEVSGNTIICRQNGTQIGTTITDDDVLTATQWGLRADADTVAFDNWVVPNEVTVEPPAGKSVTFNLASQIQGVSGVNYIITPNPLGDSITSGTLDTSSSSVTIDLEAFTSLSAGDNLLLIATDKQAADDSSDVIAWDASTVVEV